MRPHRAFVIYILLIFVGGALLSTWLYKVAQLLIPTFPKLAGKQFFVFVHNSILLMALLGSWLLFRCQDAKSVRDIGLVNPIKERKNILGGFTLGFVSLALVAALTLIVGPRRFWPDMPLGSLAGKLANAMSSAVIVAILEEILFRGAIFGALRKEFHWKFALVLSSAIYALMHFLASPKWTGDVTWLSGFQILPQVLAGFVNWERVIPAFFNLTLAGSLLALAYQRTGNLFFSMGVHAGWIFWVKFYKTVTFEFPGTSNWFFGKDDIINGWLAVIVLTATLLVFTRLPVGRKREDFT